MVGQAGLADPSSDPLLLGNQDAVGWAGRYLACALAYAADPTNVSASYWRSKCVMALRAIIGTETMAADDGTAEDVRLLATARQLSLWVMVADLIGFDGTTVGTRTGWTSVAFDDWLAGNFTGGAHILDKTIGTDARYTSVYEASWKSADNWGAVSRASYIAVARYLGETSRVAEAWDWYRGAVGDSRTGGAYEVAQVGTDPAEAAGFKANGQFESAFAYNYADADGGWRTVNDTAADGAYDATLDGAVVEDASRSAGTTIDDTGLTYIAANLEAQLVAAMLLERAGYSAYPHQNQAMRRIAEYLEREGGLNAAGRDNHWHIPFWINAVFPTSLPTESQARYGRQFGFTDWFFG